MHDLLCGFNLGRTRFHEVPLFEYDRNTPRPGRWFLMHILEDHRTLVPEESVGVTPNENIPGTWRTYYEDKDRLAVDPTSTGDLDYWMDLSIDRVFFSDRLRQAIKASGLKARWLGFRPCKVVTRGG